jgi:DNA gyrase subunit A
MGRNTQGVRLIRLSEDERLVEVERIENLSQDDSLPDSEEPVTEKTED